MDKEIMDILKTLVEGQKKLEENQIKLEENQKSFESKLEETYEIVRALKHSAEVNKAEHDKMSNDIAHIKGDVEAIKKDLLRVEEATANNWVDIARLKAIR